MLVLRVVFVFRMFLFFIYIYLWQRKKLIINNEKYKEQQQQMWFVPSEPSVEFIKYMYIGYTCMYVYKVANKNVLFEGNG